MSFQYQQSTGKLTRDGEEIWTGYSGRGIGFNNAAAETIKDVGPIPRGIYTIEPPYADEKLGPLAMRLTPAPINEMHGRGDFLIHADSFANNHSASEGCIIMPYATRIEIAIAITHGDDQLQVVA